MKNLSKVNKRALSRAEFAGLASVPPEIEWFKNIGSPQTVSKQYANKQLT